MQCFKAKSIHAHQHSLKTEIFNATSTIVTTQTMVLQTFSRFSLPLVFRANFLQASWIVTFLMYYGSRTVSVQ